MSLKNRTDSRSRQVTADATTLNEAEIQVLASLAKAGEEMLATDRGTLERGGERFSIFLEDWSEAFSHLLQMDLIEGDERGYRATEAGQRLGRMFHRERPDQYWYYYQRFYPAAGASAAHSRLCERVFGKNLCQEGMVDMAALEELLAWLALDSSHQVLDLGCGAGFIAQHISDTTGARVTGLDNSAPAITMARERTASRSCRLSFLHGDMNSLDLPEQAFDAVISLDSLYWVADLPDTLSRLVRAMRPAGQMGIFMLQSLGDGDPPEVLEAGNTELARALSKLGLAFDACDYSQRNADFWRRNYNAAMDLRDEFEAEGNGFIATSLIREAEEEFLPAIEAGTLTRYLYRVRL